MIYYYTIPDSLLNFLILTIKKILTKEDITKLLKTIILPRFNSMKFISSLEILFQYFTDSDLECIDVQIEDDEENVVEIYYLNDSNNNPKNNRNQIIFNIRNILKNEHSIDSIGSILNEIDLYMECSKNIISNTEIDNLSLLFINSSYLILKSLKQYFKDYVPTNLPKSKILKNDIFNYTFYIYKISCHFINKYAIKLYSTKKSMITQKISILISNLFTLITLCKRDDIIFEIFKENNIISLEVLRLFLLESHIDNESKICCLYILYTYTIKKYSFNIKIMENIFDNIIKEIIELYSNWNDISFGSTNWFLLSLNIQLANSIIEIYNIDADKLYEKSYYNLMGCKENFVNISGLLPNILILLFNISKIINRENETSQFIEDYITRNLKNYSIDRLDFKKTNITSKITNCLNYLQPSSYFNSEYTNLNIFNSYSGMII